MLRIISPYSAGAALFLLICCALFALAPQAQTADTTALLTAENKRIEQLRQVFAEKYANDSSNTGAKNMNFALLEVARGLDAFLEGDFERDMLSNRVSAALEEANRYGSAEAVKSQESLQNLRKLLDNLPERLDAAPPEPEENNAPPPAPEPPATQSPPESAPEPTEANADANIVYILFGVYLIAILLFGYLLHAAQSRRHKKLSEKITETERSVRALENVKGSGDDYAKIQLKQTERKYDTLEKNTADFLKMYEERLENLEIEISGAPNNQQNKNKLAALEERLARLEDFLRNHSGEVGPLKTALAFEAEFPPHEVEQLIDAVEHLRDSTDIFALKRAAEHVTPDLKRALITHSWASVDVYEIARLAQLAYVSQFNEATDDSWQQISRTLRKAGFNVDAKMAGKPCFSLDYARNLTLKQYNQIARFQTPEYPNAIAVRNHIEQKFDLANTPPEIILYVLNPTVSLGQNGVEVVLQKGAYVVSE